MHNNLVIAGIALLAVGTYVMRFAGYRLGSRMPMSESVRNMLSDAATVLLLAVAVTTALFEGSHFAGVARIAGVLFAVFLAWRRTPLILVIVGAAVMTALLRYFGVP
ncbi:MULTISPECIES: AzlD domain-containing protein [Enterobacterales]|jgi:Branched-chain amino acid transport protein (AzlD).|uniref:AzlD domain-containing protein n=1 Tax=Candidatus Pantoea communis TaxID=2608354 RepID=A0ABX0RQW1_9GAMM|nr:MULTISPECIES: AzlD domain-containing protein [Enterobacterales]MDF7649131.1 AzlD domain-containing protein [Erwiniaceae bacterium L1_54_3]KGT92592.1 branched-chain amino acid transport [Enterobacter cancerogenus]MXP55623.1 AzlD domain-containing protein [Pantoea sp. Seng]MXP57017.1 AzlD domain-containing protein [Pantoea sp. Taur]NIG18234.1 AzlD domain-containing protein [Pantoea communis]